MLLELRTYDFAPGDAARYLDIFAPEGLPLITRHLPLAGYWLSEVGALNRLRRMWVYDDLADRTARRATFTADTEWTRGFLPRGMALIGRQATQLLRLDHATDATRAVLEDAARPHSHDGPHLRDGWAALSDASRADASLTGTVVAGEAVGATLALTAGGDPLAEPAIELMRPCAFSPL